MRRLWQDFQAHKWAAVLFLVYWLATLVVNFVTWNHGIPDRVVIFLLTTPLIAGFLVGRWRAPTPEHAAHWRDRIGGGMLAGLLSTAVTFLVIRGGVVAEVIDWLRGFGHRFGELLVFCIVSCVLGVLLGLAGAVLAVIVSIQPKSDT
jgi:hypothetical protein